MSEKPLAFESESGLIAAPQQPPNLVFYLRPPYSNKKGECFYEIHRLPLDFSTRDTRSTFNCGGSLQL